MKIHTYILLLAVTHRVAGQDFPTGWQELKAPNANIRWRTGTGEGYGYYEYQLSFTGVPSPGYGAICFNDEIDKMKGCVIVMCQAGGDKAVQIFVVPLEGDYGDDRTLSPSQTGLKDGSSTITVQDGNVNCSFLTDYTKVPVKCLATAHGTISSNDDGTVKINYHGEDNRFRLECDHKLINPSVTPATQGTDQTDHGPSESGQQSPAIIGSVVGVGLLLIIAVVVIRKRRQSEGDSGSQREASPTDSDSE